MFADRVSGLRTLSRVTVWHPLSLVVCMKGLGRTTDTKVMEWRSIRMKVSSHVTLTEIDSYFYYTTLSLLHLFSVL